MAGKRGKSHEKHSSEFGRCNIRGLVLSEKEGCNALCCSYASAGLFWAHFCVGLFVLVRGRKKVIFTGEWERERGTRSVREIATCRFFLLYVLGVFYWKVKSYTKLCRWLSLFSSLSMDWSYAWSFFVWPELCWCRGLRFFKSWTHFCFVIYERWHGA